MGRVFFICHGGVQRGLEPRGIRKSKKLTLIAIQKGIQMKLISVLIYENQQSR